MGITRVIHTFDLITKTISRTHFKFGGDVPWVNLYQVCSNGHAPVIFWFFMNILLILFAKSFKKSSSLKLLGQLLQNCIKTLLEAGRPWYVQQASLQFFFILLWFFCDFCYFWPLNLQSHLLDCAETWWKCSLWKGQTVNSSFYILCKWSCSIDVGNNFWAILLT